MRVTSHSLPIRHGWPVIARGPHLVHPGLISSIPCPSDIQGRLFVPVVCSISLARPARCARQARPLSTLCGPCTQAARAQTTSLHVHPSPSGIYASWVETPRRVYLQISRASSTNISASLAFNYAIIEGLGRFLRHSSPSPAFFDRCVLCVHVYSPFFSVFFFFFVKYWRGSKQ